MRIARPFIVAALAFCSLAYGASPSSISLSDTRSYPSEHVAALKAVVQYLKSQNVSPSDLHASIVGCGAKECEISVYSKEMDAPNFRGYTRGCPVKYCMTMTYTKSSGTITKSIAWR
jgi:hypothetical protein